MHRKEDGARTRNRTPDIHFTRVALYQLSYTGRPSPITAVGALAKTGMRRTV
jgi:hypothetical protein